MEFTPVINDNDVPPNPVVVCKDTIKRLIKDIRDLIKNPLTDDGIFYSHDDDNFMKGYAMIVGPKDSVYFGGYYFFCFDFPSDFPFSPPKLFYATNDGVTRFHPNFYKSGKVCLSILNTWRGESWSACQTIRSILLTLLSILDSKPLLHEPGYSETSSDFPKYNKLILYKNIEFSILRAISSSANKFFLPKHISIFEDQIKTSFEQNKNDIYDIIKEYEHNNEDSIYIQCYQMKHTINWSHVCSVFRQKMLTKDVKS